MHDLKIGAAARRGCQFAISVLLNTLICIFNELACENESQNHYVIETPEFLSPNTNKSAHPRTLAALPRRRAGTKGSSKKLVCVFSQ